MRPQSQFCFAAGCKRQLFDEGGKICSKSMRSTTLERYFCQEHGELWQEFDRELPLAIQELHALALFKSCPFDSAKASGLDTLVESEARRALTRVSELRSL